MVFENYSGKLTSSFANLDKDLDYVKMVRQEVEVLLNGIKTACNKLIACKAIVSQNYASDFTGACSHLSYQVVMLHDGTHLEEQSYKRWILEVILGGGGRGSGQGYGGWMCG